MDIDGDEFAEAEYGLAVDNSNGSQKLHQELETLAQAALQTQTLSFSTITKLYTTVSLAEKQRLIEKDEKAMQERAAQAQQEQLQTQQQIAQMQTEQKQAELQQRDQANMRDNETKLQIALISAQSAIDNTDFEPEEYSQEAKEKLAEQIREFDEKIKLEWAKHNETKKNNMRNATLKEKQINKPVKHEK